MCWAQLGSAHPGSAIWLQQDRNWSWRGLKARVGWMSKVAHSCGLQLMLAIDQELSWAVKLAHVYIWLLYVAWASHSLVVGF